MISGGLAGGSSTVDFSNVDLSILIESFLIGIIEGLIMGGLFAILNVSIMIIFAPAVAESLISLIADVFLIALVFDLESMVLKSVNGEISGEEFIYYCVEMAGALMGGSVSGKYTNDYLM